MDKSHPDYSEGYFDALGGGPLRDGHSESYAAGWREAHRAMGILKDAGFQREPDGTFSKTVTIDGSALSEDRT